MDLLLTPDEPAFPTVPAPYACRETWDGGPFLTYPNRKGKLGLIPLRDREGVTVSEERGLPYTEHLYPTPRDELYGFCQTWLFFGLAAEFLGLNEDESGRRPPQHPGRDAALREIESLHRESVVVVDDRDGGARYLSGKKVLADSSLMLSRIREAPDMAQRVLYLRRCLTHACSVLPSFPAPFDESVRYSVAALGELLGNAAVWAGSRLGLPPVGYNWHWNYLQRGGPLEAAMLACGWCLSEVEKIRTSCQGLNTMHFLSRLRRPLPHRDHSRCLKSRCVAFQLDPKTYRPAHAEEGCACENIHVDLDAVLDILHGTEASYPLLRVDFGDGDGHGGLENLKLFAEECKPGTPYVAISHVWADGLGNPHDNSLPRCQVAKVARLVAGLQDTVEQKQGEAAVKGEPYRVWIDPLCCPVEPESKKPALRRMADVYRNATHVLVLDKSVSHYSTEGKDAAELLLRAVSSSPWMRRLWTMQEGALAQSLYFQFADRPLNSFDLFQQVFQAAARDVRYFRIWQDVYNELNSLHSFGEDRSLRGTGFKFSAPTLVFLQRSLHFRTVSVASDEAICIATLMHLDVEHVAAVDTAPERMARVWELLAGSHGGRLPARIVFFNDAPVALPGWRWAPRTLLDTSASDTDAAELSFEAKALRFAWVQDDTERQDGATDSKQENGSDSSKQHPSVGIVTPRGLQVRLPGALLRPKPRREGLLPLHPWAGTIRASEDRVLLRHAETGGWLRIVDWHHTVRVLDKTEEEKERERDDVAERPLCGAVDTGTCALIYDKQAGSSAGAMRPCRVVQITDVEDASDGGVTTTTTRLVRGERTVILESLSPADELVANECRAVAEKVAADEAATDDLLRMSGPQSPEWKSGLERVRERVKEALAEAWEARPEFVQAARDTIGPNARAYLLDAIPKFFWSDTELVELDEHTVWVVD